MHRHIALKGANRLCLAGAVYCPTQNSHRTNIHAANCCSENRTKARGLRDDLRNQRHRRARTRGGTAGSREYPGFGETRTDYSRGLAGEGRRVVSGAGGEGVRPETTNTSPSRRQLPSRLPVAGEVAKLKIATIIPMVDKFPFVSPLRFLECPYRHRCGEVRRLSRQRGRMSTRSPRTAKEARTEIPPRNRAPVPAPPKNPLAKPCLVQPTPRSARREHEVQRVIRDLEALAAVRRPQPS